MKFCSIPGCTRKHKAHGLCNPHYQNARNAKIPVLILRADRELNSAVRKYAKDNNMSISECVRTFCQWGLEA